MASLTPAAVRKQIDQRKPDPVYLIVGDDEAEMSRLAGDMAQLVEEDLRAFNLERIHAEKGLSFASIVQSARTLPMLGERRVVVVLRAERILKTRRRKDEPEADEEDGGDALVDVDVLTEYVARPEPLTTLVIVTTDISRTTRAFKAIQKDGTIVECWGLVNPREKHVDLRDLARRAGRIVQQLVTEAGQQIDSQATKLLAERAGADIATLRGDVARLLLYAAGKKKIELADAQAVVSSETAHDNWAVTNALQRGDRRDALRRLALALDAGGVPEMILGQLGWFVRDRLSSIDPRRVPAAVDALFRTDLDLKSSRGDKRVLLERLVVELCRR